MSSVAVRVESAKLGEPYVSEMASAVIATGEFRRPAMSVPRVSLVCGATALALTGFINRTMHDAATLLLPDYCLRFYFADGGQKPAPTSP